MFHHFSKVLSSPFKMFCICSQFRYTQVMSQLNLSAHCCCMEDCKPLLSVIVQESSLMTYKIAPVEMHCKSVHILLKY